MVRTRETQAWRLPGFLMILLEAVLFVGIIWTHQNGMGHGLLVFVIAFLLVARGFFVVQPNESRVLTMFGQYVGTVSLWTGLVYVGRGHVCGTLGGRSARGLFGDSVCGRHSDCAVPVGVASRVVDNSMVGSGG